MKYAFIGSGNMARAIIGGLVHTGTPGEDILELARERDIVVMRSELRMFVACGLLYRSGLAGE